MGEFLAAVSLDCFLALPLCARSNGCRYAGPDTQAVGKTVGGGWSTSPSPTAFHSLAEIVQVQDTPTVGHKFPAVGTTGLRLHSHRQV